MTFVPAVKKNSSDIKIFIDGQSVLAHSVVRKLLENHQISPNNILVNTYSRLDSQVFISWLDKQKIARMQTSFDNPDAYTKISNFSPDYIISAYGLRIIPKKILDLAKVLAFNMHVSYLPDYKGRWISSWAIINGEKEHGITFHVMSEQIDQGDILFQKKIYLAADETAYSLYHKILCEFVKEFDTFFKQLMLGKTKATAQSLGGRYFGRGIPFDGIIDPAWDKEFTERFIRAMFFPPHSGAKIKIGDSYFECNTVQDYNKFTIDH